MSSEKITPYKDSSLDKKRQIAKMFNHIAGRYDFLNHFLSLGIDRYWRKKTISKLKNQKGNLILDIATGTGDLAIAAAKLNPSKIFGIDISTEMLELGRKKIKKKKLEETIQLLEGDSEDLIFEDNKFDAVTVAFGVRNFQNLEAGLKDMRRVLKPGGITAILEFSQPKNFILKKMYDFYSSKITPGIGKIISNDKEAYSYLHESVKAFPHGMDFCNILVKCGYRNIHFTPLTFGIVTIYTAEK